MQNKKAISGSNSGLGTSAQSQSASSRQTQAQIAKRKASLKGKSKSNNSGSTEAGVLGGADYVSLMMGGRRKAKEEAAKLTDGSH